MNEQEILKVVKSLTENFEIAHRPNSDNDILIKNNTIYLKKDCVEIYQRDLSTDKIKNEMSNIFYGRNIFENSNARYSPLEADKNKNKYVWKDNYNHIDFPKMMSVLLFALLETGKCPNIFETAYIYQLTYTEKVEIAKSDEERLSLYAISVKDNIDRNRLGKELFYENRKIKNELLKFKEIYTPYVRGLPINEFTTEQLFSRIYKSFGSLIRDIYATLYFNQLGAEASYSYYEDMNGIDCLVNGISVFAYTNTKHSLEFREKKMNERHPELGNVGITLTIDFDQKRSNKVHLINKVAAEQVIDYSKKLNNKELTGIQGVMF